MFPKYAKVTRWEQYLYWLKSKLSDLTAQIISLKIFQTSPKIFKPKQTTLKFTEEQFSKTTSNLYTYLTFEEIKWKKT